jgi:hypothetical protein
MRSLLVGLVVALAACGPAQAESLKQNGKKHWLAIYSTKDKDIAIGVARGTYINAKVVLSKNGYYGVVLGPYVGATIEEVKRRNEDITDIPKDSHLSNGANFTEIVWSEPAHENMSSYEVDQPAHLSSGNLSVDVKLDKLAEDRYSTVISGTEKGGPSFSFTVNPGEELTAMGPQASIMKLDPTLTSPQVVFTRYTGGAHCCTNTWIVSKLNGAAGWSLIDAGKNDGSGYTFEDVDGDGGKELLQVDNAFLYVFDSYAGSNAPIVIKKLSGGKLEDVSTEDAYRPRLKQDLAAMEYLAKVDPGLWKSNGFLAGWAAAKMRLGQGEDAWQVVSENARKDSGFGPQECATGQKLEDCPDDNLKTIPILKAMASFLKEEGYGPLPNVAEALLQ